MILQILAVLLSTSVFAANIPVNEAELLQATGLEKSHIVKETEDSLEKLLFFAENGIQCGLEEFSIEGYSITKGTEAAPEQFEVITLVDGPGYYCAETERFNCYTHFYKKDGQWLTLGAECDEDSKFNE